MSAQATQWVPQQLRMQHLEGFLVVSEVINLYLGTGFKEQSQAVPCFGLSTKHTHTYI